MHLVRNIFATLVHQDSANSPETKVLHLFTSQRFSKSSKRQPNIVQGSRKDAYGAKPFLQLRYTKIVHLGPKHKFRIFLHD
jgi:hypothetical protein